MWNDFDTAGYSGMIAETIPMQGWQGDVIPAYFSRPIGVKNAPGIVLIPHIPGWDEFMREAARRFTEHGYAVVCPDIYARVATGNPVEVAAKSREMGGLSDESVMGDVKGALDFLKLRPDHSEKVGVIGMCSGGRHAFLAACTVEGFDACVDCWGGGVDTEECPPTEKQPAAPITFTKDLSCPLLGIFGNDDQRPSPAAVDRHEAELRKYGKDYTFHRYDGAGHGIWYYHTPLYRQEQAMDSWEKAYAFFERYLR